MTWRFFACCWSPFAVGIQIYYYWIGVSLHLVEIWGMSTTPQIAATPPNVLTKTVLFLLDVAKTAVSNSGVGTVIQVMITDPIEDAQKSTMDLNTALNEAAKKNMEFTTDLLVCDGELKTTYNKLNVLKAKLGPTLGMHGAFKYNNAMISIIALPKGTIKDTRGLPKLKDHICTSMMIDHTA